jgi:hypothetical protein
VGYGGIKTMIDVDALKQISFIVENDKTSSTYKYVLLKSVIDASQRYDHLIRLENSRAHIPLGLIIERWMFDYFPFVFKRIRQQHSHASQILNKPIEEAYEEIFDLLRLNRNDPWEQAYKAMQSAFKNTNQSSAIAKAFLTLAKELAKTITTMPMKFIGKEHYELFQRDNTQYGQIKLPNTASCNILFLTQQFGYFSISETHYNIFRYLGQNLYGTSTIALKWKEKTDALNDQTHEAIHIIDRLSNDDLAIERDTSDIRSILEDGMECVWSGKILTPKTSDIDHVLPFSVWYNNDLWNLLPADKKINNQKRDKIPSPNLIEKRADVIIDYWKRYEQKWSHRFNNELDVSLLNSNQSTRSHDSAIASLIQKAGYLIYDRGFNGYEA